MDSPPYSMDGTSGSMDSVDDFDDYFANYVPLSNLPTPPEPTMCRNTLARESSYDIPSLRSEMQGPAVHLANLVPSGVCLRRPSPSRIQSYLERSTLPFETIALAGCILDALSLRFSRKLREAFVSSSSQVPLVPEVIVLAALGLATSYHNDDHLRASHWTDLVARGTVTVHEFNVTSRCVLIDIGYGLHSFTPEMVEETLQDMQRVGRSRAPQHDSSYFAVPATKPRLQTPPGSGFAMEVHGLMTPGPTPI